MANTCASGMGKAERKWSGIFPRKNWCVTAITGIWMLLVRRLNPRQAADLRASNSRISQAQMGKCSFSNSSQRPRGSEGLGVCKA